MAEVLLFVRHAGGEFPLTLPHDATVADLTKASVERLGVHLGHIEYQGQKLIPTCRLADSSLSMQSRVDFVAYDKVVLYVRYRGEEVPVELPCAATISDLSREAIKKLHRVVWGHVESEGRRLRPRKTLGECGLTQDSRVEFVAYDSYEMKKMEQELFECVGSGDVTGARELLECMTNPNIKNESGLGLLHVACKREAEDMVLLLLQHMNRKTLHVKSAEGDSPLHVLAAQGTQASLRIARILLDAGAPKEVENKKGMSPFNFVNKTNPTDAQKELASILQPPPGSTAGPPPRQPGAKFWLNEDWSMGRADYEQLRDADKQYFDKWSKAVQRHFTEGKKGRRPPRRLKMREGPVSSRGGYDWRFPCPCDPQEGCHDWKMGAFSDGDGDGDFCSLCGAMSMAGGFYGCPSFYMS